MHNMEIRAEIMRTGLRHWEVAAALGISETSFSRKLRRELPEEERQRVLEVIGIVDRRRKGADSAQSAPGIRRADA